MRMAIRTKIKKDAKEDDGCNGGSSRCVGVPNERDTGVFWWG